MRKRDRWDHCGPDYAPRWFRRLLSKQFDASCKIHDMDYSSGRFTQKESDKRFLKHMLRQSGLRPLWIMSSLILYYTVRVGGFISYKGKK